MLFLAIMGGQENDGDVPGAFTALNDLGQFQATGVRHANVEYDERKIGGDESHERLLSGLRPREAIGGAFENALEHHEVLRLVVHQQYVNGSGHAYFG